VTGNANITGLALINGDFAVGGNVGFEISGKTLDFGASVFALSDGSKSLQISFASLTHNMSIREIDVCSGNTAMKMLVLASAPY
jgi:hypothetical protein